jgi:DNA-binding IclR family transcriptional regulator
MSAASCRKDDTAARILAEVVRNPGGTSTEIGAAVGVAAATARRLLLVMEQLGIVREHPASGGFFVGWRWKLSQARVVT